MKIAIVGAGKLGIKVATALLGGSHSVTVIDKDKTTLEALASRMDVLTITGNGKQLSILRDLHIASYDLLLACTDRDEKNIVIASFAKHLGCSKVIARVRDPEHVDQESFIRDTMSIDYLVNPDMEITSEITKYLMKQANLNKGLFLTEKTAIVEFPAKKWPELIGLPLSESKQYLHNMLIVSISKHGKIIIPHGDTIIEEEDVLYLIGFRSEVTKLNAKFRDKTKSPGLQRVMIIGGGKTGLFLAEKLSKAGIAVKIIEKQPQRCLYLEEHLPNKNCIILQGDATDIALLKEESFDTMDALVTCTGFDEDNLMLALLAKTNKIPNVIAKVSRGIYTDMMSQLGVDMALNPLDITASKILFLIRGKKKMPLNEIIQGQAEVIDIRVEEHMKIKGKSIKHLSLPKGLLIAAIHRGDAVLIPDGNDVIEVGDRVTIFCLLSELTDLEKLLNSQRLAGIFK